MSPAPETAAVVVPVLLLGMLTFGGLYANAFLLALMQQILFLTVGWHYVKQVFGTMVVTSAVQRRYLEPLERRLLLFNLYSVWAVSWVFQNLRKITNTDWGISYPSLNLPAPLLTLSYALVAISLVALVGVSGRKYIQTGRRPATSALVSFWALYIWFIPLFYHPLFFIMIPFFHSLQYLLFVVALKKNQATAEAINSEMDDASRHTTFFWSFWGFLLWSLLLGGLSFSILPTVLQNLAPTQSQVLGSTFWFFAFGIFINIHHYFIDNVIWRGDNEQVKTHLVQASQV